MKAIQIQSHGDLEVLKVKTLPDPDPDVDELLVRIKASAVNPLDSIIRTGEFPIAKEPPLILGEEAAGVVERNGGRFRAGDRVILVPEDRSAKDADEVIALAAQGKYRAVVDKIFPMSEVVEATRYLDGRKAVGKVVL